jgi:uncharacterized membrane protein YhaH (DUF805 family)
MGFGTAVATCFRKYVGFRGRAPRSEFWYWALFRLITLFAAVMIDAAMSKAEDVSLIVTGITFAVLLLPTLAVMVRRLHDRNLTGFIILVTLVPGGGLVLIILACLEGTFGPNAYGPRPGDEGLSDVF